MWREGLEVQLMHLADVDVWSAPILVVLFRNFSSFSGDFSTWGSRAECVSKELAILNSTFIHKFNLK